MKNLHTLVAIVATLSAFVANGQYSLDYKPTNGQDKILVSSQIKNMKPLSRGVRIIEVSNNSSMIPVIDGKEDSIFSTGSMSFLDTFKVSLNFPKYYYIREIVITSDTSGKIDTANSTQFLPVLVTPKFKKPTQALFKLIVSQTSGTVSGNFTSGFDSTAIAEVIVSYGDTLYSAPSYKYSFKQKVYVKAGSLQNYNLSFPILINSPGDFFSYRVKVYNSIGDTLSPIFWGKTLSDTAPAMVSSPYNVNSWSDSISFTDETIATGVKTKHTSYIATSMTAKPFDSTVVMIAPGQPDGIILRNSFKGLNPESNYCVWSAVKNSMNSVPFASNRVLVQTGKVMITVFNLKIDSTVHANLTSEAIHIEHKIPSGKNAHIIVLGRTYPNGQTIVIADLTVASNQRNSVVYYKNCLQGKIYQVCAYGSDDNHTRDYDAWEVSDTFTFYPNYTASVVKIQKEKIGVYPNPPTDGIIHSTEPIEIYGKDGAKVTEGKDIDLSNLSPGIYYYRSTGDHTIRGKIQLK